MKEREGVRPRVEDRTLGDRLAAGDRRALEELYDELAPRVYGLARSILRDSRDAEEVVSDTFVQAWRNAASFDPARGTLGAWLIAIARSRALDRRRSGRRRERIRDREERRIASFTTAEGAENPSEAAVSRAEVAGTVGPALAALPPEQRRAIELAYLGGLTHREIAEALNVPLGTVKTRIRSGMQALRDRLVTDRERRGAR